MVVSGHRSFLGVSDLRGPRKAVPPRGAGRPGHAASTEAHGSGRRPSSAAGGPVARLSWSHSLAALHLYLTHPRRCPFLPSAIDLPSSARACHLASPRTVTGGDAEWPGRWGKRRARAPGRQSQTAFGRVSTAVTADRLFRAQCSARDGGGPRGEPAWPTGSAHACANGGADTRKSEAQNSLQGAPGGATGAGGQRSGP